MKKVIILLICVICVCGCTDKKKVLVNNLKSDINDYYNEYIKEKFTFADELTVTLQYLKDAGVDVEDRYKDPEDNSVCDLDKSYAIIKISSFDTWAYKTSIHIECPNYTYDE